MLRLLCFYLLLLSVAVVACPAAVSGLLWSPACHLVLVLAAAFVKGRVDAANARAAADIAARKEPPSLGVYHAVCFAARRCRAQRAAAAAAASAAAADCSPDLVGSAPSVFSRGVAATCDFAVADGECGVGANPTKEVSFVSAASWCLSDSYPRTNDFGVCGAAGAVATTVAWAMPAGSAAAAIVAAVEEYGCLFSASAAVPTTTTIHHHHKASAFAPGSPAAAASLVFRRRCRAALGRVKAAARSAVGAVLPAAVSGAVPGAAVPAAAMPAAAVPVGAVCAPTFCGEHLVSVSARRGVLWGPLVRPFWVSFCGSATTVSCAAGVKKARYATAAAAEDLRRRIHRCAMANGIAISAGLLAAVCAAPGPLVAFAPSVEPMCIDISPVVSAAAATPPINKAMIAKQKRRLVAPAARPVPRLPDARSIQKPVCKRKAKASLRRRADKVCQQYRRCLAAVRARVRAARAQRDAAISARPIKQTVRRLPAAVSAGSTSGSVGAITAAASSVPTPTDAIQAAVASRAATSAAAGTVQPRVSAAAASSSSAAAVDAASSSPAAVRRFAVPRAVRRAGRAGPGPSPLAQVWPPRSPSGSSANASSGVSAPVASGSATMPRPAVTM